MVGLADHRPVRKRPQFGAVDDAVVAAMRQAIDEAVDALTRTGALPLWRTGQILKASAEGQQAEPPSQRTLHRLLAKPTTGTHITGSATTLRPGPVGAQGPDFADTIDERQRTRSHVAEEPRIRRPHLPGEVRSDSDDLAHRHRPPTCRREIGMGFLGPQEGIHRNAL